MGRRINDLPQDILDLLHLGQGVFDSQAAAVSGIDHSRLSRLVHAGLLTRLATSCYAASADLEGLDAWSLHAAKARAFAISWSDAFLTGWSAAVKWGMRTAGSPPRLPTVVRPWAPGRGPCVTPHGRITVAKVPNEHLLANNRWGTVGKAWAVADLARTAPLHHALIVADSAVRDGADLMAVLPHMSRWRGVDRARLVAKYADPRSEIPIETLGRFTFIEFDLPMFVSNAWVGMDKPEKRVDGLLPYHWIALEADGAVKYNDRPDADRLVREQNAREFHLRRLGLDVVRYGWEDAYFRRRDLAGRFGATLRDHPVRDVPVRWWKDIPGARPVVPEPEDWPSPHPVGLVLPAGWWRERDALRQET